MAPVIAILAAVVLLATILRLGTAALVVTGLARDVAAFQVRSAFFGVGFTTHEAESAINHPARRRIVQSLMLLGSVGITGVIGSIVLALARAGDSLVAPLLALVAGLLVLAGVSAWRPLNAAVTHLFERLLRRYTSLDTHDYTALLHLSAQYAIQQLTVRPDGPLADRSLAEARERAQGVVLLAVERADGTYLGAPEPATVLRAGDRLTVYGHDDVLAALAAPG